MTNGALIAGRSQMWTIDDQRMARRHGWGIFQDVTGVTRIECTTALFEFISSEQRFKSDAEALDYVLTLSNNGDQFAQRALTFVALRNLTRETKGPYNG